MRQGEKVAVVWDDVKSAALYFDRVLPIGDFDSVPSELVFDYTILEDTYVWLPTEYYTPDATAWESLRDHIHGPRYEQRDDEMPWNNDTVLSLCLAMRRKGIEAVPLLAQRESRFELYEPSYHEPPAGWDIDTRDGPGWPTTREQLQAVSAVDGDGRDTEYLEVVFNGAPRPDTEFSAWDDILQFREMDKSVELLRSFHLALEDVARGRDPGYIERVLQDRLAALRRAARDHRLDLAQDTARALVNSKSLLAGAVSVAAGIGAGSPLAIGAGAAIATVGEIVEASVSIVSNRRSRASWLHEAELGYVQHVEDQLG